MTMANARRGWRWVVAALLYFATALSCTRVGDESSSAPGPRVLLSGGPEVEVTICALAIDPQTPSTLYAARYSGGLDKSTDGGASWNPTGLTNGRVWCLAIDPQTPNTLYAATSDYLFKSTDGGTTWNATGPPGIVNISSLAIDPISPATLYAGSDWGVHKSADGGATWSATGLSVDEIFVPGIPVTALAIDPVNPSTIYASTRVIGPPGEGYWWVFWEGGVFKSTDAGANWGATIVGQGSGYPYDGYGLVIDPQTPTTLYSAGMWFDWPFDWTPTARGVSKTTDGGEGWGDTGLTDDVPWSLAIDPQTPTTLYAWEFFEGGGLRKSTDGGATWTATGLDDVLLAHGVNPGAVWSLAIDPLTPNTLYAGTAHGVFKSTDGGATWEPTGAFLQYPLAAVSVDPSQVVGGNPSTGTVTLATAAPEGGAVVDLSSSNSAAATVPATVTVPAGATSANFTVSTSAVAFETSSRISATLDGVTRNATLTVAPAPPPDTEPPNTAIISAVDGNGASLPNNGATLSNGITLSFSGTDNVAVAGFECRLDGASFAPCTSPVTFSGLAVGQHVFQVRAVDSSGNPDVTPALFTWTVDALPETAITSAVDRDSKSISNGGTTRSPKITFTFTGSDNVSVAGFECSLDGAAFAPCSSPFTYSQVSKAEHTFKVRAFDNNGYRDPTPATFTWTRR
jgi:hypothetical protein